MAKLIPRPAFVKEVARKTAQLAVWIANGRWDTGSAAKAATRLENLAWEFDRARCKCGESRRDKLALEAVRLFLQRCVLHELDECLRVDGVQTHNPHPAGRMVTVTSHNEMLFPPAPAPPPYYMPWQPTENEVAVSKAMLSGIVCTCPDAQPMPEMPTSVELCNTCKGLRRAPERPRLHMRPGIGFLLEGVIDASDLKSAVAGVIEDREKVGTVASPPVDGMVEVHLPGNGATGCAKVKACTCDDARPLTPAEAVVVCPTCNGVRRP